MTKHEALRAMLDGAKVKHPDTIDEYLIVRDGDVYECGDGHRPTISDGWHNMPADGYYTFTPPMTDDEIVKELDARAARYAPGHQVRVAYQFCARLVCNRSLTDKESGR